MYSKKEQLLPTATISNELLAQYLTAIALENTSTTVLFLRKIAALCSGNPRGASVAQCK